ncbi:MAG: 30S ribosomal protein S9 [Candidatus Improbicoccus pseudotrichonymphae]|uniref:Small ribosomal subunit protein uS9 n=1 Tax=Candidatus Improbicoccus pseudotrichonymphae TaxID=3033792 RepID=A0AA48HY42_9FIRM|nr:MAG: 30S ribosomal protein S9 [Candidatus Improbicoccus pseudotrichonymphae]
MYKSKIQDYYGTGKKKCSIARVRIMSGNGKFIVNKLNLKDYFVISDLCNVASCPISALELGEKFDVICQVRGGGVSGQASAIRHGLAKALLQFDEENKVKLRDFGFLTRDSRVKERKKYGLRAARKRPQYSKR